MGATAPPFWMWLLLLLLLWLYLFVCLRACYRGWWCTKTPLPRVWKIYPIFLRRISVGIPPPPPSTSTTTPADQLFSGLVRLSRLAPDLVQNPHPRFQKASYGPGLMDYNFVAQKNNFIDKSLIYSAYQKKGNPYSKAHCSKVNWLENLHVASN